MAGKNMAAPVTNCAATGGMPVSAPDDAGYTTPNSYAHVKAKVTARKIAMRLMVVLLFSLHRRVLHAKYQFGQTDLA